MRDNLIIAQNVIHYAAIGSVKKLLFYGSNCMYPLSRWLISENSLHYGPPEPTNRAFAMAKIAGLELCVSYNLQYGTNFIVAVPASIYGPTDHFGSDRSHVLASIMHKMHIAQLSGQKEVVLWGDGSPKREFIYADDVADASIFLMENFNPGEYQKKNGEIHVNIATGFEKSILELAEMIKSIVGYEGRIVWDTSKPNGVFRKLLSPEKIERMGWRHKINLEDGLRRTYQWYLKNLK